MRKLLPFLILSAALPLTLAAQDNSTDTPKPKPPEQDKSVPALEKPGMAAPETAPKPAVKKAPAAAPKIDPNAGRVVEEIIA